MKAPPHTAMDMDVNSHFTSIPPDSMEVDTMTAIACLGRLAVPAAVQLLLSLINDRIAKIRAAQSGQVVDVQAAMRHLEVGFNTRIDSIRVQPSCRVDILCINV